MVQKCVRIHLRNLLPCLCIITRWGHDIVQSDHAGQHTDGAVHESHSYTLCPPRSQRHHPQDHGEQTVLRGKEFFSLTQRCECCELLYTIYYYVRATLLFCFELKIRNTTNAFTSSWSISTQLNASCFFLFSVFPSLSWTLPNWKRTRTWTWTWLISSTSYLSWWRRSSWLLRSYHRKNTHTLPHNIVLFLWIGQTEIQS